MTLTYIWTHSPKSVVLISGAEYNTFYGDKMVHQENMA